jgi:hypothetical protein
MTASVPAHCLSITHECIPVARPGLSVDVWFCCRQKAVRLSVLVLQPQPGGRNRGGEGAICAPPVDALRAKRHRRPQVPRCLRQWEAELQRGDPDKADRRVLPCDFVPFVEDACLAIGQIPEIG